MSSFTSSLRANIKKALWRLDQACYKIAIELFSSVVHLSPSPSNPGKWATGHLANQWFPEQDGFSEELDSNTSQDGAGSLARIATMRPGAFNRRDGMLSLTNNLSYAVRAEKIGWPKEDGWSGTVGPYRMVALSLQKIAAKYP